MSDDLTKIREDFGHATDQLGSAIKSIGERLTAVEGLARELSDTVTKNGSNVTELSRGLSHVTEQHAILQQTVETTHKHFGQQLAQALGLTKIA